MKGRIEEKNPNWRGGKPKCEDCNKVISYNGKRCVKCARKKSVKRGKESPLYVDGRTPENHKIRVSIEYCLWRKSVFERDNFTCQKCENKKGGSLKAHHIRNFAEEKELRTSIENGITFCENCHKEFHKKYGIKKNTREQLQEFLIKNETIN